ncbi:phenylalanine--tRNA ligase subunit beta [bacterium BRH_c32]|nr:MAG: phenylalanine--tRNA ligase subunit beta [bacterium BRH_c32]
MKISFNWLKEYIDLSGIDIQEVIDKVTLAGLEIEEVIDQSKMFENFVIGHVKEVKKHPNADKLHLCVVSDGVNDLKIVCGAPNVAENQKVVVAKIGAVIPENNFEISKAKIRGEESFGMLCSERELNISANHAGIFVLDNEIEAGTTAAEAIGLNDVIIEVAITPNRQDALSHIGFARDVAAIFNRPVKFPSLDINEIDEESSSLASVEILDPDLCPRYVGKVVKNVVIKESPEWLKTRLKCIGLRPINNVVDVTNFVMHEVGQPLHAFDLDYLSGSKVVVKKAGDDKSFTTLDSKKRELQANDLMICDGQKTVAIAGVMGGENSEVTVNTKNILIESAFFNPSSVRKTAKKLGLQTDASYRFERGTDPEITVWAAKRTAQLIQLTAGGEICKGEIDAYPVKFELKKVELRFERISKILGYDVPNEKVTEILTNLGFEIVSKNNESVTVAIPLRRHDVEREIDLIEELARIYGYEKIPDIERVKVTLEPKFDETAFENQVRETLNGLGFYEIITNSLLSETVSNRFGNSIGVLNPQNMDMSNLRTSLLPGMLTTISRNLKVKENNLQLFEIGKVFNKKNDVIKSFDDFSEDSMILGIITGRSIDTEWYSKDNNFDFYDLKGYVYEFLKSITDKEIEHSYKSESNQLFEYSVKLELDGEELGIIGKLNDELCGGYDIEHPVFAFNFNLEKLSSIPVEEKKFKELLKYPKVFRDLAFVIDNNITHNEVSETIKSGSSKLLHNIKLFDIFQSESLGEGKKSLAFQLEYFDETRTLTEDEVEKDFKNIIKNVEKKFNAKLRG